MSYISYTTGPQSSWNEVAAFCRENGGIVCAKEDGEEDMALMTRKACERMSDRVRLYALLEEGMEDVRVGRMISARKAYEQLKADMEYRACKGENHDRNIDS